MIPTLDLNIADSLYDLSDLLYYQLMRLNPIPLMNFSTTLQVNEFFRAFVGSVSRCNERFRTLASLVGHEDAYELLKQSRDEQGR